MNKEDRAFYAAYARAHGGGERAARWILNQCDECNGRGRCAPEDAPASCAECGGTGQRRVDE